MINYEYFLNTICYNYTTNRYRVLGPEYHMNTYSYSDSPTRNYIRFAFITTCPLNTGKQAQRLGQAFCIDVGWTCHLDMLRKGTKIK